MIPPILTTARLTLSPPRASDFEDSAAMWSDPLVTRHIGGRTSTPEESWQRLLRARGLWAVLGYGYWAARETASGRYVGEIGFADFHRGIEPSIDGVPEMGWALASWAHGQGFASEAIVAALAWARDQWGDAPIVCIIDPDNAPSLKLAHKIGFLEVARTTYRDAPTVLLQRG
ncbi:acetyltransferase [Caulobacter sp. Root487D2Y]|uniref:GNAT family N-acetyltransferase n=1 Tax=Caulobacter sp. Root487D2Y TaxID=1736547 RepID=UPI000700B172|nr:GNAT family N-acetyltransferase [Caulobacter sp. Root487D2Y]KQY31000.1 acetyltransferase [Caulobacter sp. Root487D2Y]